jgi:hypothetical protein
MIKRVSLLATALLFTAVTVQAEEPVPYNCDFSPSCEVAPGVYGAMGSPVMSKFNLSIGGYVKLDYAHNTTPVGPLSPGAPGGGIPVNNHKEESIFTAKQTRFWLKVGGPTFLGAKTNALIEADFYGQSSLANEFGNLRMRHAYGSMDWTNTQVLFGQFWDIFGPAAADTIDFRQGGTTGAANNPRVPQIRLTQKVNFTPDNTLKFVVGVQNPVQDSATQAAPVTGLSTIYTAGGDNSASTTGGYGSMVNAAGQVMFSSKVLGVSPGFMGLGMSPLQLGFFGLYGSEKIIGNKTITVDGYGAYAFVPVLKSRDGKNRGGTVSLEAQIMEGEGLNVQGLTSVATVLPAPNAKGAKGFGVYSQLKYYATQDLGLTGGYMRRGAMDYNDYRTNAAGVINPNASFEKYNESMYANATYDLNAAIRLATEYAHNTTMYTANTSAGSNHGQNNIFRVAAYYFF